MPFRSQPRSGDSPRPNAAQALDLQFSAYAGAAAARLRDTAYLMSRDWHLADDLVQTTLLKLYINWPKVAAARNIDAYAHTVLLRSFLDHRRRRSSTDIPIDPHDQPGDNGRPAGAGYGDEPVLRLTLLDALGTLKPLDRAIVVLRYWEDYSVESVADLLDIKPDVVKTRSRRALATLQARLHEEAAPHAPGQAPPA